MAKKENVWSIVLLVIVAIIVGSVVLRVVSWLLWYLIIPLCLGLIVVAVILRLVGKRHN